LSGHKISNIEKNELLSHGYDFTPGRTLCFESFENGKKEKHVWEVNTNEYNIPYIRCLSTGALAYFSNDGRLFLFRHYEGEKNTLLYYFFLASFKVQLGFYKDLELTDRYPLNLVMKNPLLLLQDFVAPFFKFLRSEFRIRYDYIDNAVLPNNITLSSESVNYFVGIELQRTGFSIGIDEKGISDFKVNTGGTTIVTAKCTDQ
jgi:hypothetical protein